MSEEHGFDICSWRGQWFVVREDDDTLYLREDGIVREAVIGDNEPTGWFDTREDAEAAVEKWKQLQGATQ